MSAPTRWKDSPDAPVGMRELLGSAKRSVPLDEATQARLATRIARTSIVPAAAASATIGIWAKLAAAGAIGLAAAGTVVVTSHGRSEPSSALTEPKTPSPVSPTAKTTLAPEPVPAVEPVIVAEPPLARPPAAAVPVTKVGVALAPAPAEPASTTAASVWTPEVPRAKSALGDELGLLEDAKRQMERSPETSLEKLAEHRARHPVGVLASERDLMELDALRRTGRTAEAAERARAWLAREPYGIHSARVRQILAALE